MIDWIGVITNAVWLLGLSVVLAALSYADWSAHRAGRRFRAVAGQPVFHALVWSGLTLFCAGVALAGGRWWERVLWGALAVMAAVDVWQSARVVVRSVVQRSRTI
jgi:hypothetical protein